MAMIVRAAEGVPGIPESFPILFDDDMMIIEAAFAYLIEHATVLGRSHAAETVRTYAEHLHDWFDALEQSDSRLADRRRDDCRCISQPHAGGSKPAHAAALCAVDHQRSCPHRVPLL